MFTCFLLLQADYGRSDILQSLHHRGDQAAMEVHVVHVTKSVTMVFIVIIILSIYTGFWH